MRRRTAEKRHLGGAAQANSFASDSMVPAGERKRCCSTFSYPTISTARYYEKVDLNAERNEGHSEAAFATGKAVRRKEVVVQN
jgi:hypothetical protein